MVITIPATMDDQPKNEIGLTNMFYCKVFRIFIELLLR